MLAFSEVSGCVGGVDEIEDSVSMAAQVVFAGSRHEAPSAVFLISRELPSQGAMLAPSCESHEAPVILLVTAQTLSPPLLMNTQTQSQPEKIVLIPPTHEQSVFSFHVEESLMPSFQEFLRGKGLTPWRPPVTLENKQGPDGSQIIQIDFETDKKQSELEALAAEFLRASNAAESIRA